MSIPPIYIISLKRTPERRLNTQRQLDALNLEYQFVDAIDKYELHSKEYRATTAQQIGVSESKLEHLFNKRLPRRLACLLSHLKVYNLMIKHKVPMACVLEDDGYFMPSFPSILTISEETSWDILMLSHRSGILHTILSRPKNLSHAFTLLYKIMSYKKHYPQLNPHTARMMILKAVKHYFLKVFFRHAKYNYYLEIGAIPDSDRTLWHKIAPNHYIAKPHLSNPGIASAMAYMLTLPAAIKWREAALQRDICIDFVPYTLYCAGKIDLRILVPPCVLAINKYLFYGTR